MYHIEIDRKVIKELKTFPKIDQEKILLKIESLKTNPRPIGYEPLKGELSQYYRIRFGNYRIVYEIFENKLIVLIAKVANRGHVYKKR